MRLRIRHRLLAAMLLASSVGRAEIVDRVVASAGSQVVTLSAVRRQLRIEALVAEREPEITSESMYSAANRLIDQYLVLREMELTGYVQPQMAEADAALAKYIEARKQTVEEFQAQVARVGFNEDDFKKEVLWRLSVQRFVSFRFAPGVQISDAEVEKYYKEEFVPKAKATDANAVIPDLEDVSETISLILATRKTNQALDQWIKLTRETLKVRIFEEALKP